MKTALVFWGLCFVTEILVVSSSHASGKTDGSRLLTRLLDIIRDYKHDKRSEEGESTHTVTPDSDNFQLPEGFTWEQWTSMEKDNQGHGKDIDKWNGNQDSAVGELVDSFVVYDESGTGHRPEGFEPWNHAGAKGDNRDGHRGHNPGKRNYNVNAIRWDNTIPYKFDPDLAKDMISTIKTAMNEMEKLTCLKFKQAGPEDQDFFYFTGKDKGCSSYVGRIGGQQDLNLENPNCNYYIKVFEQNIKQGGMVNFEKVITDDRQPYDAESILQYGLWAFSSNGLLTMDLLDQNLIFLINSATTLTFYDVAEITKNQHCTDQCPPVRCENDGFQTFQCSCMCPSGLTGPSCERLDTSPGCGETIVLGPGQQRRITSPSWPKSYGLDLECVWLIKTKEPRSVIRLYIEEMDISRSNDVDRCYHWLEIRYNLIGQTGLRECGKGKNREYRTSLSDSVGKAMVKFNSRFAKDKPASTGFKILVETMKDDFCSPNPCKNSGRCRSVGQTFHCDCSGKWTGAQCDILHRPCDSAPCQNNGDCRDVGNSTYVCRCQTGFHGMHCENTQSQPPCPSDLCQNNGSCISNGTDMFTCVCTDNFTGEFCDSPIDFPFDLLADNNCTFSDDSRCIFHLFDGALEEFKFWDHTMDKFSTTDAHGLYFLEQNQLELEDNEEYCLSLDIYSNFEANNLYAYLSTYKGGDFMEFRGTTEGKVLRKRGSFVGDKTARVIVIGHAARPGIHTLAVDNVALRWGHCDFQSFY